MAEAVASRAGETPPAGRIPACRVHGRDTPDLILDAAEAVFADQRLRRRDHAGHRGSCRRQSRPDPLPFQEQGTSSSKPSSPAARKRSTRVGARFWLRSWRVGRRRGWKTSSWLSCGQPWSSGGPARDRGAITHESSCMWQSGTDERLPGVSPARATMRSHRISSQRSKSASPGSTAGAQHEAISIAVAIGLSLMAPTGRARALSEGACSDDVDILVYDAAAFIAAGIEALARRCAQKREKRVITQRTARHRNGRQHSREGKPR